MKCPNCPQFTSKDTDNDPEQIACDADEDGSVTAEVRVVNTCAECGTELEEYTFNMESVDSFKAEIEEHYEKEHPGEDGRGVYAEGDSWRRTDETQGVDRHGRPITKSRYRNRYYGVEGEVEVKCDECNAVIGKVYLSDSVQASSFEWIA